MTHTSEIFSNAVISGWGSEIPGKHVPNAAFLKNKFVNKDGSPMDKTPEAIINKLEEISGIKERRYVDDDLDTAEIGARAGRKAIESSRLKDHEIDGIIVAHNFGNILPGDRQGRMIPNLAAVIKGRLSINNHRCFAYDILFGCPGWIEAMIQGKTYIQSGRARHLLIIGVELISRVLNPRDLDTMLFGDGAGAVVLSLEESTESSGILQHNTFSHCQEELEFLKMGTYSNEDNSYLAPKMNGRQVFKYGLTYLPKLITECLESSGYQLSMVKKLLIHQANEKMIMAIAKQLLKDHKVEADLDQLVPFMVQKTGNASVATIPTLIDHIKRGQLPNHKLEKDDLTIMSSVGAGMHCNCIIYKF